MTTLESRYDQRVRELQAGRARCDSVSPEEVQYMLQTIPFIREYTHESKSTVQASTKHGIDNFVTVRNKSNKSVVFQRYLVDVENNTEAARFLPSETTRVHDDMMTCMHCNVPYVFNSRESELVCVRCGLACSHMEMSENNITYDQEVQQTSIVNYFAYKRLNHFTEWLNSLQAKENTEIPTEVLEAVRAEFKKERACKRGDIKPTKVRAFLKKLKLNKYYEHTHSICNALNGVPAPKLPQYLEDRLKHMFGEIQEPFEKHCPATRKNFLSYSFVLFKFCQLLGEDQLASSFPLLKSAEKLHAQDCIWKNICRELGWEFIRSI